MCDFFQRGKADFPGAVLPLQNKDRFSRISEWVLASDLTSGGSFREKPTTFSQLDLGLQNIPKCQTSS